MPFDAYYFTDSGELRAGLSEQDVRDARNSDSGLLWLDIHDTIDEDGRMLHRLFAFHPLAIEDCVSPLIHSPKIDDFKDYLFLIFHGINYASKADIVDTAELCVFLAPRLVVTSHNVHLRSIQDIKEQLVRENGAAMSKGSDFMAYTVVNRLIDFILPTIFQMDEVADELEEAALRAPSTEEMKTILKLKRSAQRIRRITSPQREMLNRLSRGDYPVIREDSRIYFRDIYDHLVRIEDMNQSLAERGADTLATHLSSVANRQNETMKLLAVVATTFLPLTLLAGIYGMNFENMPELSTRWGYFVVTGVMAAGLFIVMSWFWGGKWLQWWRTRVRWVQPFAIDPVKWSMHTVKRSTEKATETAAKYFRI
ncbi:MAG: magnesium/cobalt transporter CorA [SAR202 cluster bacterium]|nr:magnesium/cobalt transporter CorA [SAR202 cluster bacterium]